MISGKIIDYAPIKGGQTGKVSLGTGKAISSMWENLYKNLGIYWFMIFQELGKDTDYSEYTITNLPFNEIPLAIYLGFKVDLESIIFPKLDNPLTLLNQYELNDWCIWAKERGLLRDFVEMVSSASMHFADVLYQIDHSKIKKDPFPEDSNPIYQNSWQSYGRDYVLEFNVEVQKYKKIKKKAILLPCTKTRPYYSGGQLQFRENDLFSSYFNNPDYHKIVVSNIGIVPEEFWSHPLILKYSAGVPDIWRVHKLLEHFLKGKKWEHIISFIEFSPYIESLELLKLKYNYPIEVVTEKKYRSKGAKFAVDRMY